MNYTIAAVKLQEYLALYWPDLDQEWGDVLDTAYQALNDCLEMGLTNADNDDESEV